MMGRTAPLDPAALERAASVIKCLGHPLRLRLLEAMEDGERTVTDLTHLSGAPQAVVSQQLGILRGRAVVSATRRGTHVFYGITEPRVQPLLDCIRAGAGFGRTDSPAPVS
ncbi:MAG TPA: metalloregulator ArsR/SmtB family transcription factor [Gemmatimonadales bacterium]